MQDAVATAPLCVAIVNYRTPQLTLDCLASLAIERQFYPNLNVVVVDNASGDDSAEILAQGIAAHQWQTWVSFQPLSVNGGFGAGNNWIIRQTLQETDPPEYILLLNPDTVLRPQAIAPLVQFLETHPQVGIAGSRLEDPDGTPQCSAFRFPSCWNELDQGLRWGPVSRLLQHHCIVLPIGDQPCAADWLAGASLLIRRSVFEAIGLFDEAYFLYFEEVDLCHRAQQAGWECWYVPNSRVVHLVGQSSGITDTKRQPQRRPQYWFNSRRRYFLKFHGWSYAAATDLLWMVGFGLWCIRRQLQRKPNADPPQFLQDFFWNSVWVKGDQP
ncbi:MAG: glycosyltransferase family 2 protein [Thermosynechococcaceae cyanobacterium]